MPDHAPDPAATIFLAAAGVHRHHGGELSREHRLERLGFDSLDRITLAVAVEHATGRTIPDHVLATAATLGDLIDQLTADREGTP